MKYLLIVILSLFNTYNPVSEVTSDKGAHPDIDKVLINLMYSSRHGDYESTKEALFQFDREWTLIVPELQTFLNPKVDVEAFNRDMDYLIVSMKISLYERDFTNLADVAWKMLYQFKSLRKHQAEFAESSYPLDHIMEMIDIFRDINYTVHDQMFGLKYWFEFEDLVDGFQKEWAQYDELTLVEINTYFPHIKSVEHGVLKSKVVECLSYFQASLESGYRTDFEIPCDELGNALNDLLVYYGDIGNDSITHLD